MTKKLEKRDIDPNVGGGVDRDKLKASDFVFGDERKFPVVTPGDVSDAVSSWGRYKGPKSFEQFKRRLIALCKRKGASFISALPKEWDVSKAETFTIRDNPGEKERVEATPISRKGKTTASPSGVIRAAGSSEGKESAGEKPVNPSAHTELIDGANDSPSVILTVKAVKGSDNEIEILVPYGGPFGGADSDGDWFTEQTDFSIPGLPDLPRPVVELHARKEDIPDTLGHATAFRDEPGIGRWYRVIMDTAKKKVAALMEALRDGKLMASSQAVMSFVRGQVGGNVKQWPIGGEITHWPIVELTLIDTRNRGELPANPYAVVQPAKAQASLNTVGLKLLDGSEAEAKSQPSQSETLSEGSSTDGDFTMEDIQKVVAEALAAEREATKAAEDAAAAEQKRIDDAVALALEAREKAAQDKIAEEAEKEAAEKRRLPGGGEAPHMAKFGNLRKYDRMGAGDLSVMVGVLEAADNRASNDAYAALAMKLREPDSSEDWLAREVAPDLDAFKIPTKANEINQSTYASYGDEWIGVTYSTQLWESIRTGTPVLEALAPYSVEVPQGSESIVIPLESTDPTWYVAGQATVHNATTGIPDATVTDSNLGTAQKSLTVNKLGARTMFTEELTEDSLIPWAAQLRRQMEQSGADHLESAIIDGDTTRTNGINDVAGTAATTDWHIVFDGMRHSGLVTTTANGRDGGAIADSDFIETVKLMGVSGKNASPQTTAFILSPPTWWKVLQLVELKTQDVFSNATLESGTLTRIWNYPVFLSYNYNKSSLANTGYEYLEEATGFIDLDTASDNSKGSFLAVRWDQWMLGYKRRFSLKTSEIIQADAHQIVAFMRVGLAQRDTEASAISYNLTV
jgi:hypothetical protein